MEHFDVIIVGAGLSGIGAGVHLSQKCPDRTFTILEGRPASGGTWDLFRYPGVRSDSDMYTLGYSFKPWTGQYLADGPEILSYIRETAKEYKLEGKIRYNHKVVHLAWSSKDLRWVVNVAKQAGSGDGEAEQLRISCNFVYLCTGYYNYEHGYNPALPGEEKFTGPIIHPQKWPEGLDYQNKRVVVIGSGATAVTLVPVMAQQAAHVTMLQRTPTYIVSLPRKDSLSEMVYSVLPVKMAYSVMRWKNIVTGMYMWYLCQKYPNMIRKYIIDGVAAGLHQKPEEVMRDFSPPYKPWEQRLCLVPDNNLFRAIRQGKAAVVTDIIDTFTPTGIKLQSGKELQADIVIKALGLEMQMLGGFTVEVDGKPIKINESLYYRGVMLGNVPNLVAVFGYLNASWTLKADLVSEFVCRLLNEMKARGYRRVVPVPPEDMKVQAFASFSSGYLLRAMDRIPKQGTKHPWVYNQNYVLDLGSLRYGSLHDKDFIMSKL